MHISPYFWPSKFVPLLKLIVPMSKFKKTGCGLLISETMKAKIEAPIPESMK